MSLGFLGMLKSRSNMDVVSIIRYLSWYLQYQESIRTLFKDYILLGAWDIQVESFNHLTSSYLKWCACSQISAFPTALINTWKERTIFEIPK